jgi:DeoR family transcriptional regulator, suf operon transcriptional repressor
MQDARFLQTTRGKIVTALRRRHSASAVDLAGEFGLSPNAVRQQLLTLERDGYVSERAVRRGPTKPTLEYSLTPGAADLFPQHYDRMLNAVLRGVKESLGADALSTVIEGIGQRAAVKFGDRMTASDAPGRAAELATILRENGVEADVIDLGATIELREHNCPYGKTVGEHPEVCSIIHTVLRETVSADSTQVESIATGGDACRFEIKVHQSEGDQQP